MNYYCHSVYFKKFYTFSADTNQRQRTVRAYKIKLAFQELFNQPADVAEEYLKKWYYWATHSKLEPIKEAAQTVKKHWHGILKWFTSKLTNGVVEGINGEVQAIKSRARGFRNTDNFITMVYIKLGGIITPSIHTKQRRPPIFHKPRRRPIKNMPYINP